MRVLAIDPGTAQSAWAVMSQRPDGPPLLLRFGLQKNEVVRREMHAVGWEHLAIEMVASYGMPVGREVFETCVWIGRFVELAYDRPHTLVYRREVKLHLCNSSRAKDANVRQAILDRYPRTGGGKTPQVGTKAKPGPLFGVRKDIWAAIGVGLTWLAARTSGGH